MGYLENEDSSSTGTTSSSSAYYTSTPEPSEPLRSGPQRPIVQIPVNQGPSGIALAMGKAETQAPPPLPARAYPPFPYPPPTVGPNRLKASTADCICYLTSVVAGQHTHTDIAAFARQVYEYPHNPVRPFPDPVTSDLGVLPEPEEERVNGDDLVSATMGDETRDDHVDDCQFHCSLSDDEAADAERERSIREVRDMLYHSPLALVNAPMSPSMPHESFDCRRE